MLCTMGTYPQTLSIQSCVEPVNFPHHKGESGTTRVEAVCVMLYSSENLCILRDFSIHSENIRVDWIILQSFYYFLFWDKSLDSSGRVTITRE